MGFARPGSNVTATSCETTFGETASTPGTTRMAARTLPPQELQSRPDTGKRMVTREAPAPPAVPDRFTCRMAGMQPYQKGQSGATATCSCVQGLDPVEK